jgi:SAM-dependent methyltransferase
MARLITDFRSTTAATGLDVGCQDGTLVDRLSASTGLAWEGVDPGLSGVQQSAGGAKIQYGWADDLAYPDDSMDVILFANVYEHVTPDKRVASLTEMKRVLKPGGIIVGQIPNPYFPIESHSRLPFMGWLPIRAQKKYWRLAPVPWEHDFFVVTRKDLAADADEAGLRCLYTANFNYPPSVIPHSVQWVAKALAPAMKHYPWAWQFVLRKPL